MGRVCRNPGASAYNGYWSYLHSNNPSLSLAVTVKDTEPNGHCASIRLVREASLNDFNIGIGSACGNGTTDRASATIDGPAFMSGRYIVRLCDGGTCERIFKRAASRSASRDRYPVWLG